MFCTEGRGAFRMRFRGRDPERIPDSAYDLMLRHLMFQLRGLSLVSPLTAAQSPVARTLQGKKGTASGKETVRAKLLYPARQFADFRRRFAALFARTGSVSQVNESSGIESKGDIRASMTKRRRLC